MDGHLFDDLVRSLVRSRRTLLGSALAAGSVLTIASADTKKKKKKPCKKKCKTGCCTKKYGKCIQPAQQSATQCGTGGEICRSTNCGGGGEQCAATCEGCCAGNTCVKTDSQTQCGRDGVNCFACDDNQECAATHCCGKPGHACDGDGECCLTLACEENACCSLFSACIQDDDCCQLGTDVVCANSQCVVRRESHCEPGWICEGGLSCPASGICPLCDEGESPCGSGCCGDQYCCVNDVCCSCCTKGNGNCCVNGCCT